MTRCVAWAVLEPLAFCDPPASTSRVGGAAGGHHHTQLTDQLCTFANKRRKMKCSLKGSSVGPLLTFLLTSMTLLLELIYKFFLLT